jgi:hypothetical protein
MDLPPAPPVVDVSRQVRIETALKEAGAKALFSPFNIAAVLVFFLVVFFMYKRYRDKRATEQAHGPSPVVTPQKSE